MKKNFPVLKTDKEAQDFLANADLTEYDLSKMQMVRFEFQPKTERVNMRLPGPLLDDCQGHSKEGGRTVPTIHSASH